MQDYVFNGLGPDGNPAKMKLSELFAPGRDNLIVYNMIVPALQERHSRATSIRRIRPNAARGNAPCSSCKALLDQLDPAVMHLKAAGFNFAVIAKAPIEQLRAFAQERGWKHMRLLSSALLTDLSPEIALRVERVFGVPMDTLTRTITTLPARVSAPARSRLRPTRP